MDEPISPPVHLDPAATGEIPSGAERQADYRPSTPPPPPTHPDLNPEDLQGGSIVLIDPTTSGIIGTLTPASPPSTAASPPGSTPGENSDGEGLPGDKVPQRRDPTYSYRLSISDLSLRTCNAAGSAISEGRSEGTIHGPPQADVVAGKEGEAGDRKGPISKRSSWMTDDASFWTARGTLRMHGPVNGEGQEREREVVVAYVKADASLNDLFPPYMPTPSRPSHPTNLTPSTVSHGHPADPSTLGPSSRLTAETDSPFPSRILHLFPRLSTLPRNSAGSTGSGSPASVTQGLSWPSMEGVDAGTMMASAGSHAEAAFWRLVMPGISGIYGWTGVLGQAYEQMAAYLPLPLLTSSTPMDTAPLLIESSVPDSGREARLYSEETIYTLRMPSMPNDDPNALDLGPTVRPVWVKKRAALPVFPDLKDDWGREGGMRQHI